MSIGAESDILDRLHDDHDATLAEVDRLRSETDARRAPVLLRALRRAWVIHALAEETVVYRELEAREGGPGTHAGERFVEHEIVEGLLEKLSNIRPGTIEWKARLNVARDLIEQHFESERDEIFERLTRQFDRVGRVEMGRRFGLAREKLALLEDAKAA